MDPNLTNSSGSFSFLGPGQVLRIPAKPESKETLIDGSNPGRVKKIAEVVLKESSSHPIKASASEVGTSDFTGMTVRDQSASKMANDLLVQENEANVREFLKGFEPPDVNGINGYGNTPLIAAILAKNAEMVKLLSDKGADITAVNKKGWTPLAYAVSRGDAEMIKLLQNLGADINGIDGNGWTPLALALVMKNSHPIVNLLKELGADFSKVDGEGWTPLTLAIAKNNYEMVELLSALGSDLNGIDGKGWTPLSKAISINDPKMVELLVQLGADINKTDNEGWTPFIHAVAKNDVEMINLLKEFSAEENLEPLERTFLAHTWGIQGSSELRFGTTGKITKILYEGLPPTYTTKMLAEYLEQFFDETKQSLMTDQIRTQMINAITQGFPLSNESASEMAARVQHGEPVIIGAGTADHVISLMLFNGQLAVCNRGEGRQENAVEFYSLPSEDVTEEIIEQLTTLHPDIESFNQMLEGLNLPSNGGYHQKDQKVGNCAWASPKAAFGALCHLYFGEEQGSKLYKEFTTFVRERSLDDYHHKSNLYDMELLRKIEIKQQKKGMPSIKLTDLGRTAEAA